jgi:hypothetical protein
VPVSKQVKTESAPLPAAAGAIVNRPNLINLVNDNVVYVAVTFVFEKHKTEGCKISFFASSQENREHVVYKYVEMLSYAMPFDIVSNWAAV